MSSFFFNDTATTEIYPLSLHDALPIFTAPAFVIRSRGEGERVGGRGVRIPHKQQIISAGNDLFLVHGIGGSKGEIQGVGRDRQSRIRSLGDDFCERYSGHGILLLYSRFIFGSVSVRIMFLVDGYHLGLVRRVIRQGGLLREDE